MDTRKIFADNLSRLLEERGLEQQRVASDLNISTSTLSAWVTGQRFPRADIMQSLAQYLHVTVSELVDLQTDEKITSKKHRILFDRTKELTDKQMDIVLGVVDGLLGKENDSI